jgi:hypothetical protein
MDKLESISNFSMLLLRPDKPFVSVADGGVDKSVDRNRHPGFPEPETR